MPGLRTRECARRIAGIVLAIGALVSIAASASDPAHLPEAEQQEWASRLAETQDAIDQASLRVMQLEAAYSRAQHSQHPRGAARAQLKHDLTRAQRELEAARKALPELVEEARRAGVYPEVLRPYRAD